jgi:glucose-1-phosphate cytidylyltransferase
VELHRKEAIDWKVNLIDTGLESMTGGRLRRLKNYIGNERFMLTYGDGLSNVDIDALTEFHESHGKMVTMTGVHPSARFGELTVAGSKVTSFEEKPQVVDGWVNGGFMIIEPQFLDFIDSDTTILEKEPLQKVANMGELMCFPHEGFWQCMDTKRDRDLLEDMWNNRNAPWDVY